MSAEEARQDEAEGGEVERLRQELAAVRQRLQDEVAYRQAQAESSRQRSETEQLRLHAEELKRRRQAEQALEQHRSELAKAREAYKGLKQRYNALQKDYLSQEEKLTRLAEEDEAQSRAAARAAWQSAEEEVGRLETELGETRQALTEAHERNQQLEQTLASLQGLADQGGSDEDEQAALRDEVAKLRKALELSERGREQANQRAVRLADQLVGLQAQTQTEPESPAAANEAPQRGRAVSTGAGNAVPVDLTEANAVLVAAQGGPGSDARTADPAAADLGAELAEEFQIIPADASLERDQLQARQNRVERESRRQGETSALQERTGSDSMFTAREATAPGAQPAPGPAPGASAGRHTRRSSAWITGAVLMVLAAIVGGAGYWFLGDLLPF